MAGGTLDLYLGATLDGLSLPDGRKALRPVSNYAWSGSLWLPILVAADGSLVVNSVDVSDGLPAVTSAVLESSHLFKTGAGNLYGLSVTIGTTSGYVMLFDATVAPADGAVTPLWAPYPVASNGSYGFVSAAFAPPLAFTNGLVAVFSSTGPFTKTASATSVFSAQVK